MWLLKMTNKFPAIRKQYYPIDGTEFTGKPDGKNVRFLQLNNKTFKNWVVGVYDMQLHQPENKGKMVKRGSKPTITFVSYIHSVPKDVTDKEIGVKQERLQKFLASILQDIMVVVLEHQARTMTEQANKK